MYDYADPKRAQNNKVKIKPSPSKPVQRKANTHAIAELNSDALIPLQAKIDFSQASQPLQRREGFGASDSNHHAAPPRVNKTGLPDRLKTNIENLSGGMDLSDVKVHRNSAEPEKIGALAYTKGTDIHLGPGQEKHLPHEAWHVVQQKQGRVPVNTQFKGLAGNDNAHLEKEADVMGEQSRRVSCGHRNTVTSGGLYHSDTSAYLPTIQRNQDAVKANHSLNYHSYNVVQCVRGPANTKDIWLNYVLDATAKGDEKKTGYKTYYLKTLFKSLKGEGAELIANGSYLNIFENTLNGHLAGRKDQAESLRASFLTDQEKSILEERLLWHDQDKERYPQLWNLVE